jgi:hypothetical protein
MERLCVQCVYGPNKKDRSEMEVYRRDCKSPEAPITDFIDGYKLMGDLNKDGCCPWYKDRRKGG